MCHSLVFSPTLPLQIREILDSYMWLGKLGLASWGVHILAFYCANYPGGNLLQAMHFIYHPISFLLFLGDL